MKAFQIIIQVTILYVFFLTGTWLRQIFQLPIPGGIVGMLLLLLVLLSGLLPVKWFDRGSELLLKHMPLMFLPITVGIINYRAFFYDKGLLVVVVVLLSTMLVMLSSALIVQLIVKGREKEN